MPTLKASEHVRIVLGKLDQIRKLEGDERTQATVTLYHLFKKIQEGAYIVAPLYPESDRLTATVEEYRKALKPEDVLDDDPGPFRLAV
jgi:hypothetical protein